MPLAPYRQCTHPGCREVHRAGGPCPKHKGAYDRQRGTATERGYDARWRKLRKAFLANNPLCVYCLKEDRTEPATQVDHKVAVRIGGAMYDWNNLQALCDTHHSRKTATEDGGFGRG